MFHIAWLLEAPDKNFVVLKFQLSESDFSWLRWQDNLIAENSNNTLRLVHLHYLIICLISLLGNERQRRRRRQENLRTVNATVSRLAIVRRSGHSHQQINSTPLARHLRRPRGCRVRPTILLNTQTVQLPLARQPLYALQQYRHQLGACNIICNDCQATHWIEERSQKGTREIPKFSACCMNGSISLPELPNAPTLMEELLTNRSDGNFYHNLYSNRYSWQLISEEYSELQ